MKDDQYPFELTLLIPTFNEGDIIAGALQTIAAEMGTELCRKTEVIITDDGTDNLPEVIAKSRLPFGSLEVIRNNPRLGKGKSLAAGFAKANGAIAGFLDADLSTPPSYIKQALKALQSGHHDIFIGSRKIEGAQVTRQQFFVKDILGNILGVIARGIIFQGMRNYQDTQCGFKFYKNEIAKTLYHDLVAGDGLNDLEILIRANLMNYRVKEQGVVWTDIRESKRPLRLILMNELTSIVHILLKYKLFPSIQKQHLERLAESYRIKS